MMPGALHCRVTEHCCVVSPAHGLTAGPTVCPCQCQGSARLLGFLLQRAAASGGRGSRTMGYVSQCAVSIVAMWQWCLGQEERDLYKADSEVRHGTHLTRAGRIFGGASGHLRQAAVCMLLPHRRGIVVGRSEALCMAIPRQAPRRECAFPACCQIHAKFSRQATISMQLLWVHADAFRAGHQCDMSSRSLGKAHFNQV